MSLKGPARTRLRRALRRHAREGWVRAVFAAPGEEGETEVVPGPGAGVTATDEQLDALVEVAAREAGAGRVKQTLVLDDRTRVRIDARYGKAKVQRLDDERITKVMGGKERALRPDTSGALLQAIGIMNPDGSISAKNAKKYKQVCHLVELCRPAWERVAGRRTIDEDNPLRVLDLACGNSYLTFVMAEALRLEGIAARLHGIDARADVVERSRKRAQTLSMPHVTFDVAPIREVDLSAVEPLGGPPDIVLALHACDTATDEALARTIQAGTAEIYCAPCCHRELSTQLERSPVPAMLGQGLLKRDYAATLTDALRVELLECCGYIVDTVEFVASTHTPKNLLIRAHRRHPDAVLDRQRWRLAKMTETCRELGVEPTALKLLS